MGYFEVPCLFVYDINFALVANFLTQLESQAHKHVSTSPSSVDREPKATGSGNARIHGRPCPQSDTNAGVSTLNPDVSTEKAFLSDPMCPMIQEVSAPLDYSEGTESCSSCSQREN